MTQRERDAIGSDEIYVPGKGFVVSVAGGEQKMVQEFIEGHYYFDPITGRYFKVVEITPLFKSVQFRERSLGLTQKYIYSDILHLDETVKARLELITDKKLIAEIKSTYFEA